MPELPEITVLARQMNKELKGKKVTDIESKQPKNLNIPVASFAKIIKGKTADAVYSKIVELGLVSNLGHAAYLGSELAKAEIALRTGKEYIQDKALFTK